MIVTLPPADWTRREGLALLTRALGAENMRWVGGAVRDTLLGVSVADIDCATIHRPETVIDRCREAGIRTVPTGIDHGTVTAILADGPVEVTTLRRDVATDGRRATVSFASEWRDDAARRDFTINALYVHPETLEISDYFDGMADLEARRVRFIGDAEMRIREDYLRILRFFRFQARFGQQPDAEALAACTALAPTLKGLSRERIGGELTAILALPDPRTTVRLMADAGVLREVLPEARERELAVLDRLIPAEIVENTNADPIRRVAALVPPIPTLAEAVSARLRLSRAQRARLVCAAERNGSDANNPRALAYREGLACARDRLLLANSPVRDLDEWTVPQFPLKGGEIVARGVAAGPQVARIMQRIEKRWVEEGFPPRQRVDALLEDELKRID
ncbi:CCA tRNA nucleotidyltransferase [Porphyrobacter algicida]|uniref:CCA tRNA nucleotidyltransferase n=1 Tax=Qipengyuania algicida TaxID=1836209 RepID=A0A845AJY4_9SPHN|nr:CCA tRNA nucleotidyltransferase [Qipengyuania algicida]MXP29175.1 CCA tRNA nucleotidyltransferase [Qipengyuania algicida]